MLALELINPKEYQGREVTTMRMPECSEVGLTLLKGHPPRLLCYQSRNP
jgi:hypothetical protein